MLTSHLRMCEIMHDYHIVRYPLRSHQRTFPQALIKCAKLWMIIILCDLIRTAIAPAHFSPGPDVRRCEVSVAQC